MSIKILPFLNFEIIFSNFFGSIICFFVIFLPEINFFNFSGLDIKKKFLLIKIRQLGIGLFGLSKPLIFRSHATFSGALTKR